MGEEDGEVDPSIPNAADDDEDLDDEMILNTDALLVTGCAEG